MLYNLKDLTFIMPVMIDSDDRLRNVKMILTYLNKYFETNIIIYEAYKKSSKIDFLYAFSNLNIQYMSSQINGAFHRTKYLNELLKEVKTSIVVNYDVDVLLEVDTYIRAYNDLKGNKCDIIYPFGKGKNQICLYKVQLDKLFEENPSIENVKCDARWNDNSDVGFCIFFKTDVYKKGGGENESFISWGPEDLERFYRFKTLGYKINRYDDVFVYHLSHIRTNDSNSNNSWYEQNMLIYDAIIKMDKKMLKSYIKSVNFYKN